MKNIRVGSGERAPKLVFIPSKCVGEVIFCIAWCIIFNIEGGARLSNRTPSYVVMSISREYNLPFCPLDLSPKTHVSSASNWTFLLRKDRARA